jgi:glutaminyl-peptide cyclotransferase
MRFSKKDRCFWPFRAALFFYLLTAFACNVEKKQKEQPADLPVLVPFFSADSAYQFIERQVAFGPRIPNTVAHQRAGDYFIEKFKSYGWTVTVQEFDAFSFDDQRLHLKNIIASYKPDLKKRVLLAAHWDTRPFADKDSENKNATFDGANDGASGVGVLLEIARAMSDSIDATIGVDIIFFDGEDWGEKEGELKSDNLPDTLRSWWCLGSQHWSRNKHQKNYSAMYGILLDMVGARRAQFFREGASMEYAPRIVDKVWTTANRIGYSDYFVKQTVGAITDDHIFVNEFGKIPMIDIVQYQPGIGFFGDYHHTQKDNLSLINKETLQAVGTTLLHVIYSEEH